METSAYANGAPSSLWTRPLRVTGFWATAQVGARNVNAPASGSNRWSEGRIAPPAW